VKKSMVLRVDKDYYPKEAVLATCYRFLEDNYIFLERVSSSGKDIKVSITPKRARKLKNLEAEFKNELVSNTLRYKIAERNKKLREYIVKTALFFSQPKETIDSLLFEDSSQKEQDWEKDPLGIAIPWEEKYGKKKKPKD